MSYQLIVMRRVGLPIVHANRYQTPVTGTDCWFGFEYRLILSMFYVWFRVLFDTQYILCLVSSII